MHVIISIAVLGYLLSFSLCWFPGQHKEVRAIDGSTLFYPSSVTTIHRRSISIPATKIRGVNLGSLFVVEPWIVTDDWANMGCGTTASEFDCVSKLGQDQANMVFTDHYENFINETDILTMRSYGLNTIRIPVGYWMKESLVFSSEYFPQGGLKYLQRVCGWASDAGLYIIIDMHGAPGAQHAVAVSTGQYADAAGFYVDYQYQRGIEFVSWLANMTHTVNEFRNVGMIGLVNEPIQSISTQTTSMRETYYSAAYDAIREVENSLSIPQNNMVHIQVMNALWGAGNPNQNLTNTHFMAYDDHRYLKLDPSVPVNQTDYILNSCTSNRNSDSESPTIVGEFSLSPPDIIQSTPDWTTHNTSNDAFYSTWFAAQVSGYEKYTSGWIFWTWKTQLGDFRWSYSEAVERGIIPIDLGELDVEVCSAAGGVGVGDLGGYLTWLLMGWTAWVNR